MKKKLNILLFGLIPLLVTSCSSVDVIHKDNLNIVSISVFTNAENNVFEIGKFDEYETKIKVEYSDQSTNYFPLTKSYIPNEYLYALTTPGKYDLDLLFRGEVFTFSFESAYFYDVNFYNGNNLIYTDHVKEGNGAQYIGDAPTKESDEYYSYVFKGWDKDLANVTQSYSTHALFDTTDRLYEITWLDYDETILLKENYKYGEIPSYKNEEPSHDEMIFDKWVPEIKSVTESTTYTAKFNFVTPPSYYEVSVFANNSELGKASGSGSYCFNEQVTVTAEALGEEGDVIFKGWYDDDSYDNCVSTDLVYSFEMPEGDVTLYAKFLTKVAAEEENSKKFATKPMLSSDGKTITYGLYPQTNVNDSSLISSLNALTSPESNGWYLYNNEYYAKVSASPYLTNYEFDNGTVIEYGTTYWFKCEPITWNVLSNNNGEYYILSSVLLDAHCYYNSISNRNIDGITVRPNNYEYSDIRTWLNNDFYNTAFALGNSNIQTATVDNSPETTDSSSNPYACDNTQDKVFLPSYQDYTNSNYGFSTSDEPTNTRYCKTTDWTRAKGGYYKASSPYLYNGWHWARSPYSGYSDYAWVVDCDGYLGSYRVYYTNVSVRPALVVKNVSIVPTQDEEWSKNHGVIPVMDEINKTITYGLYPQTNVNDSSLISSLNALTSPESNGWYLYNNEYYAKVSANPYSTNFKFDNGTVIENGTTYWFKCEPITWNILSNNNGEYYILSSVLLDAQRFGEFYRGTKTKTDYKGDSATVYANNYKFSDIRTWLNTDFYNTAFALGNSNIQTATVDNSPETTDSSSNPYACDNTQDKVFLPSYQDYTNSNYGFSTSIELTSTRVCRTTDWARARGGYYNTSSSYLYKATYWTRSPYSFYSYVAWSVYYDGYLGLLDVDRGSIGVRPALNINL